MRTLPRWLSCRRARQPVPRLPGSADPGGVGPAGAVNGFAVLEAVLALPVSTWHYKADPPGVRHLGPMAQDWRAAFGLGADDTRIWCVDANGVALVSIQALHRLITDLESQIAGLRTEVDSIRKAQTPASRTREAAP